MYWFWWVEWDLERLRCCWKVYVSIFCDFIDIERTSPLSAYSANVFTTMCHTYGCECRANQHQGQQAERKKSNSKMRFWLSPNALKVLQTIDATSNRPHKLQDETMQMPQQFTQKELSKKDLRLSMETHTRHSSQISWHYLVPLSTNYRKQHSRSVIYNQNTSNVPLNSCISHRCI